MPKRPAAADAAAVALAWPRRRRVMDEVPHAVEEAGPAELHRPLPAERAAAPLRPAGAPPRAPPASPAPRPLRRPASFGTATTNLCHGRPDEPCCFSTLVSGQRARYQDASLQCPWCNAGLLRTSLDTEGGRGRMSRALRFFWQHEKAVYHKAVERLPESMRLHWPLQALGLSPAFHSAAALGEALATPQGRGRILTVLRKRQATDGDLVAEALKAIPTEHLDDLATKLAQEPRRVHRARLRAAAETVDQQWERLLAQRRRLRSSAAPDEDRAVYAERVREDRSRARRKFFPERPRQVRHTGRSWTNPFTDSLAARVRDLASNDTGLPRTHVTPMAAMLEDWCKQGAWGVCERCYSLEPRHLKEVDTRRVAAPAVPHCRWCRRDGVESAVEALRPLEIDCGPYQRPVHGYRVHTALIRLLWATTAVEDRVSALQPRAVRKRAQKAFAFLMQSHHSEYAAFVKQHRRFLRAHPDACQSDRRRPLQMIEAPGIETALWPDLYWHSDLCETVQRATDARRLQRQQLQDTDSDEDGAESFGRSSIRRSFLKKILGPILDYAGEYELLQFVFDLSHWSDLGSKRHIQPQLPMRILLKGAPFTPAYWAVRHAAILDLQRQCGYPVLFKTWAPYEWSAPYHRALLHQMNALLRSRLHLEGPETLHLAHILVELLREWVAGGSRKHGESSTLWRTHCLSGAGGNRINFAARLEYQDGKRKAASQDYHGRGAIHLHAVLFAESLQTLQLHRKLLATELPEGHALRGYVLDQLSYSGSGWPVHAGASCWDDLNEAVRLHHTERDAEQGVRAYGLEEVDILKSHVDNLVPQAGGAAGRGLLLRYVATYNAKFSGSFHNELLDDTGVSGYGIALRVLSSLHPSEPEMWATLCKQLFPDFALGGTMLPIVAPWPTMVEQPAFVRRYEQCAWRSDDMTLLDFLRKSNASGDVVAWLQKAHAAADTPLDLGEFASVYPTFGEKIIAAETVGIFNDKYFGQWLMLNVPFRAAADFLDPEILAKVPARYQLFACAHRAAPEYWADRGRIVEDLQLAAHRDTAIANFLALLDAQQAIVQQYLRGEITLEDEVPEPVRPSAARPGMSRPPTFNRQQQELERQALERFTLLQALKDAQSEEEVEEVSQQLETHNSILACMGGPGTGKTFLADHLVRVAVERGYRVLYALPTGQLACRMRQRHPDIHVDTCAGAFLFYRPLSETIALMTEYDMVVIDEALQLSAEEFGRLRALFLAAGRRLLLLLGDDWQLPSIAPERASDHPQWRFTRTVTLTEVRRCKCPRLQAKLDFLRYHKPVGQEGKRFVNRLCYKHKAWTGHDEPTSLDIADVLRRTENNTTFVTCTKAGAAIINALAVQVLFSNRKQRLLGQIPGTYEDNEDNYDAHGRLRSDRPPQPSAVPVYVGMRLVLTRNQDKENHYVNGMVATVEAYCSATGCLRVRTQTGRRLAVYRYTDPDVPSGRVVYYPVRVGYAGTIYKYQGAELQHVTVWLNRTWCRAAAYVALSRVARDEDYLVGGVVTGDHLVPAK
ncbi:pif1 [Symbiodinium sp. CCMP2592]|nr:pif1 [Symbiodinium sp. CCMP2592]